MPRRPSTSGEMLRLIRAEGVDTRAELGRLTGLSRPAVTLRVTELIQAGLVLERPGDASTGGRPPARLEFNAAGGVVLVANLGRRRGQAAVCDLSGRILAESITGSITGSSTGSSTGAAVGANDEDAAGAKDEGGAETAGERDPETLLRRLLEQWDELLVKAGYDRSAVRGVGIGSPGTYDLSTGVSNATPMLPHPGRPGSGVEVRPIVAERFAVPTYLDNDVNVAALGEHQARYRDEADDLLFVKLSTGIGAGVIAGGRIQRGALGAAGELGHIPVRDGGGVRCRCGNLDCVEAVAGGAALLARSGARNLTELVMRAQSGDPEAVALIREAGRRVGEVIATAVTLLNPAVVVLGGDLTGAYEPLIAGVREVVYQRATALATRQLRIEPSRLGDTAGLEGCAALVLERILSPTAVDTLLSQSHQASS